MANQLELTLPPGQGYKDLQPATQTAKVYNDNQDVTSLINLVNKYLWFALGIVAMVVIVIAGIKLITARGDDKEMKKVNQLIVGLITGVLIAILSYLLVRAVSNLF